MNGRKLSRALEGHLRAQLTLMEGCRNRAVAARDARLRSAWISQFVRLSSGMAATGSAIARLRHAGEAAKILPLALLRLPDLPPVPAEGEGGPCRIGKTTAGGISSSSKDLPRRRAKSKGGAPRGNRNAQTTGCHTAAFQEFGRALTAYSRELKVRLALLTAALPRQPRRVLYLIETPTRCYTRTVLGRRAPQRRHPERQVLLRRQRQSVVRHSQAPVRRDRGAQLRLHLLQHGDEHRAGRGQSHGHAHLRSGSPAHGAGVAGRHHAVLQRSGVGRGGRALHPAARHSRRRRQLHLAHLHHGRRPSGGGPLQGYPYQNYH
jgi:hypothetical protein